MNTATLYKLSYGMYIISSSAGGRQSGQVANSVFQITSEPATIAVSINKANLTHEVLEKADHFAVSILGKDTSMLLIGKFGFKSGRDINKFDGTGIITGKTGVPIVTENAVGYIEAKKINSLDVGTHTIFIGSIIEAETLTDHEPMTYAYYHQVKKGFSPKTAPTYIKQPGKE